MSRYPCRSTLYTKKKTCPNCCTEEDDSRVADRYWWDLAFRVQPKARFTHTLHAHASRTHATARALPNTHQDAHAPSTRGFLGGLPMPKRKRGSGIGRRHRWILRRQGTQDTQKVSGVSETCSGTSETCSGVSEKEKYKHLVQQLRELPCVLGVDHSIHIKKIHLIEYFTQCEQMEQKKEQNRKYRTKHVIADSVGRKFGGLPRKSGLPSRKVSGRQIRNWANKYTNGKISNNMYGRYKRTWILCNEDVKQEVLNILYDMIGVEETKKEFKKGSLSRGRAG